MSHSRVFCNGESAGSWPYGYTSFAFELTGLVRKGENLLAVSVDNKGLASRWYPGAGIYRHVRLILKEAVHIAHWGTSITTPEVTAESADIRVRTSVINTTSVPVDAELTTSLSDKNGGKVAESSTVRRVQDTADITQIFTLKQPDLWSLESTTLYRAVSTVRVQGVVKDTSVTSFGIRSLVFDPWEGFFLNDRHVKLNGVCMHHDLGPLGAAVNTDALKRQLTLLQEMGCNAVRTSHNPPTPELLDLCDRMGFLVIDEAFDEWRVAKVENGYHILFDEWAERD